MKRWASGLLMVLGLIAAGGLFGAAAGPAGVSSENAQLKQMLDELAGKVDDAERRMIAHPKFIEELREFIGRHRASLREVFFHDNFADGEFRTAPAWRVLSGDFRVNRDQRLASFRRTAPPQEDSGSREPLGIIIGEILKSTQGDEQEQVAATADRDGQPARIETQVRFAAAFEVDFNFISHSDGGSMEVVLLGGAPPATRYALVYHAAPSAQRPIELVRQRNGRRYTIEAASTYPDLDDGRLHRIQWLRDAKGNMRVLIDGQQIIATVELFYRDEFTGLQLVNHGGSYEWGPLKIMRASESGA